MTMFSHVMLGSNDIARSKAFYDAALAPLGVRPGMATDTRVMYMHDGGLLILTLPIDGQPACHANGGTLGFAAKSAEDANAFHAAGLAAGGVAIEDAPGVREGAFGKLYLAYLRDPDGNKICSMMRM
jgi:catechol 2,3-dioxygenase-like lactoylglutathione lyase family enzyme